VVYNSAERTLIDEIRKETESKIEAKENEISLIVSQLEGIDAELQNLHSSNQELTAEQRAAETQLKAQQDEYRTSLASLQDERSRILEESRAIEANLRAQLEARSRDLAAVAEQSAAAIETARAELARLSADQEKTAAVEAQLGAYFFTLNDQIHTRQFPAAAGTIKTMRQFLDTPAFTALRSMQARRELYAQSINSLEGMVNEAQKNLADLALAAAGRLPDEKTEQALAELREENSRLEKSVEEKDKTIAAFSSQGTGLNQRLSQLERDAAGLRSEKSGLERQAQDLNRQIADLRRQQNDLQTQNADLQTGASQKDQQIASLQSTNATLTQTVSARDTEIRNLNTRNSTLTTLNDTLQKTVNDLTAQINQQGQQE
jgi:chromosome segregation ATPase